MNLEKNMILNIAGGCLNDRYESVVTTEDGKKLICPGLLPGEKAEIRIVKAGKNISFGKIIKILKPDKGRVRSECLNRKCSSCELISASYEKQLELKKENIAALYGRSISIIPSPQYAYRSRAVLPVGKKGGKTVTGTYRQNSHEITGWGHPCPVLIPEMKMIIEHIKKDLELLPDEKMPEQIFIRGSGEDIQVGFILKEPSEELNRILKNIPGVTSAFYSVSSGTNSVIIKDPVFVSGPDYCNIVTANNTYKVSPVSFFQANIFILDRIVEKIRSLVLPGMKILDLYSGCGVLSDFPGIRRTCVESNPGSFGFLEENENTELITGDAAGTAVTEKYDMIIADPPRKGIDPITLNKIDSSGAETFIYLSCEPKTQKRDIDLLDNYAISEITAYDMFPNTIHIESLAILKRKES